MYNNIVCEIYLSHDKSVYINKFNEIYDIDI